MGVLDDAIREHLELQRQHGATDDEIKRKSQEALGPPRRERPQAEEAGDSGDQDGAEAGTVVEPRDAAEPGTVAELETAAEPSPSDAPPPGPVLPEQGENGAQGPAGGESGGPEAADQPPIPDPPAAPPETGADTDVTMLYEGAGEKPPDAEAPPAPGPPTPAPGPPTPTPGPPTPGPPAPEPPAPEPSPPEPSADTAEGADRKEGDPAPGEDVLEDTPEFLQETPEDERLWFEQKPPRDFDFDD